MGVNRLEIAAEAQAAVAIVDVRNRVTFDASADGHLTSTVRRVLHKVAATGFEPVTRGL
jgi:hypothetical protein